jgi:hypothetical protein
MPGIFVHNEYSEEKVENFIKRQKLALEYIPNPWSVIIIDDCTDDPRIFNKPLQQSMFKRGRQWNCMYILSLQYAMDVKPVIRTNVDGIFILREPLLNNRQALYKNYASIIPTFDIFCELMDKITEDFTALYIHNATNVNDWTKCVYYWKPPIIPDDWRMGCTTFWDHHNQRYNKNYKDTF